ncbi:hypothetical protein [Actinomyces naeslundii]
MNAPFKQVSFEQFNSLDDGQHKGHVGIRIANFVISISTPLLFPAALLWFIRIPKLGWLNLSAAECGAAICALTTALIAKNWESRTRPESAQALHFKFLWMYLALETAFLIASDPSVPVSELLKVATTSQEEGGARRIVDLAAEVNSHSPGTFYVIAMLICLIVPTATEAKIAFKNRVDENA